ncbi:hypothetical protein [Campylobacter concisus]|nr:hypothetical protein [Campylobacter concisus]
MKKILGTAVLGVASLQASITSKEALNIALWESFCFSFLNLHCHMHCY